MSYPTRWQRLQQKTGWPFGFWLTGLFVSTTAITIVGAFIGAASLVGYFWKTL